MHGNGLIGGKSVLKINAERKYCYFLQSVTEFETWWQSIIKHPESYWKLGAVTETTGFLCYKYNTSEPT